MQAKPVWGVAFVLALAPSGCSGPSCAIEDVVADRVDGVDVDDCGHLTLDDDAAAFAAAHDCVIEHLGETEPFVAQWQIQGTDSRILHALVGLAEDDGFAVYDLHYDGDPSGGSQTGEITNTYACTPIAVTDCTTQSLERELCVSCEGETLVAGCD